METDRSELTDLASDNPAIVNELKEQYFAWAKRCGVMEFDDLRALRQPKFRAKREAERAEQEKRGKAAGESK